MGEILSGAEMTIAEQIMMIVDIEGQVRGTRCLAERIGTEQINKVSRLLRKLEEQQKITVVRASSGRGHKTIISRRYDG
jgi:CRISPR/Cas system-associated endonuclease/helicase Cas3